MHFWTTSNGNTCRNTQIDEREYPSFEYRFTVIVVSVTTIQMLHTMPQCWTISDLNIGGFIFNTCLFRFDAINFKSAPNKPNMNIEHVANVPPNMTPSMHLHGMLRRMLQYLITMDESECKTIWNFHFCGLNSNANTNFGHWNKLNS